LITSAAVVVVPNAEATVEGTGGSQNNEATPFDCNFTGFGSQRVQQVYLGSEVGNGQIIQVAFRPDGEDGVAFGPTTINGVTIKLSTTSAAPDGLAGGSDAAMDTNVGADVVTVFNGSLTLQSAATGGPPRNFDILIPLTTPFTFNSSNGNLLMEVNIPTCTMAATTLFDTQDTTGDSISRTHHWSTPTLFFSDSVGLVTQFTIEQADLAVTKAVVPNPVIISGSSITFPITVTNNGPDPALNVVVSDTVPAHTTFESISAPGFSCATPPVGGTGTITCTKASLAASTTVHFTLVVRLAPATLRGTDISNTVAVSSDTFDPSTSNNSATVTTVFEVTAPAMSTTALFVCALLLMAGGMRLRSKRRFLS
jgi:uncharacterized repeat protein (TIGR01451 family)